MSSTIFFVHAEERKCPAIVINDVVKDFFVPAEGESQTPLNSDFYLDDTGAQASFSASESSDLCVGLSHSIPSERPLSSLSSDSLSLESVPSSPSSELPNGVASHSLNSAAGGPFNVSVNPEPAPSNGLSPQASFLDKNQLHAPFSRPVQQHAGASSRPAQSGAPRTAFDFPHLLSGVQFGVAGLAQAGHMVVQACQKSSLQNRPVSQGAGTA